ncbi:MAG: CvpA family protein [Daejeonella sp.]|uniref:CvpA family protein n=1 Tax=Daejeonella sp. TaxID=2805397 RepID=UPI003C71ED5B
MNIIDVILIIVIGISIYSGWKGGFIESALELSIWLGSFLLAFFISVLIVNLLQTVSVSGIWIRPIAFIVLLIFFSQLITRTGESLTKSLDEELHYHWGNNALGIIPGLVSGIVYSSLISFFALSYPLGNLSQRTKDSYLANLLNHKNGWPGMLLSEMAADIGYRPPEHFTVHTKGAELVPLAFRTKEFRPRPDLEKRMLDLINQERKKFNLRPMTFDKKLAQVATKHSSDMLQRGYFSHYTPEGLGPFDRMRKDRVRFRIAGENLALAQTLQSAHQGFMESPVHKANILHDSFGRAGIGILDAGANGIMVTQNFRN